jgi:DNA modification methylase
MYKQLYEQNTEKQLLGLLSEYDNRKLPIEVDFRHLVKWLPYGERATHFIHPYPGKLLYHIPHFFLSNQVLCRDNGTVLDPFCGSGTVLLESILNNKNAIGLDVNPLAVLLSKVKTKPIDIDEITKEFRLLIKNIPSTPESNDFNSVVNIDYWFYPHVKNKLQRIFDGINKVKNTDVKNFFYISLSACLKHVSLANPRMSVPVRLRAEKYSKKNILRDKIEKRLRSLKRINVFMVFYQVVESNIQRLAKFMRLYENSSEAIAYLFNSQTGCSENGDEHNKLVKDGSIDIVITSPPYVSAQKYIRASSLSLGWLNLCEANQLKKYESICIGREHYPVSDYKELMQTGIKDADKILDKIRLCNPLRAHIAANYLVEMENSIKKISRSLKSGGFIVLIIAENRVCNFEFKTPDYINSLLENNRYKKRLELVDDIRSRALLTKRNGTSGMICREHICIYQKEK